MDAILLLRQEHEAAETALTTLLRAAPAHRSALWSKLQAELGAHEEIEDGCLYVPLMDEALSDSRLSEWVCEGHEAAIHKLEEIIDKMDRLDPQDGRWLIAARQIRAKIRSRVLGTAMAAEIIGAG